MFDKFNLGLLDLLTLILPGGLLIGLAWKTGLISEWQFFDHPNLPEWVIGAAFAAAAYVMGHFVYLISSYLDDLVFAKIKEIWWPKNTLFTQANGIRTKKIKEVSTKDFNNFKYALGYLLQHSGALYFVVERLMAESKFFRSFCVVLFLAAGSAFYLGNWQEGIVELVFMGFSMVRYLSQRAKSIEVAYQYLILLHEDELEKYLPLAEDASPSKKSKLKDFFTKLQKSLHHLINSKS